MADDIAAWQARLRRELPRQEILHFLSDLQALVAALREKAPWQGRLTPRLRAHPELVLAFLHEEARTAVAAEIAPADAYSATGDVGAPAARGQRAQGE